MKGDNIYFLKISGTISAEKQREFLQTVQFVFNHLPGDCLNRNLALDTHTPQLYHLYSSWNSQNSLFAFRNSHEFQLLNGAFQTLGGSGEVITGVRSQIQLFELNHPDA